ncbi:hypothetical protein K502DRAFT_288898, partial [Neoconidiobolus thromboides FSU 785]
LVEQNTNLKKEVTLAERKLASRNERISNMEALLKENQEKLNLQSQKFEKQLNSLKERLEAVMASKQQVNNSTPFSFGRIAKPLRGTAPVTEEQELKR